MEDPRRAQRAHCWPLPEAVIEELLLPLSTWSENYYLQCPIIQISSTLVRERARQGLSHTWFLPEWRSIQEMGLYR